jgi:hypothetical protein
MTRLARIPDFAALHPGYGFLPGTTAIWLCGSDQKPPAKAVIPRKNP